MFDDQVAMQFVGVADQPLAGNRRETAEQLVLQRPARAVGDDGATVLDKSLLDRRCGLLVVVAQHHHPVAQRLER